MKGKRAHAGYSRQEWRDIRVYPAGPMPIADPAPREIQEIKIDLRDQLERMWKRFPQEFR